MPERQGKVDVAKKQIVRHGLESIFVKKSKCLLNLLFQLPQICEAGNINDAQRVRTGKKFMCLKYLFSAKPSNTVKTGSQNEMEKNSSEVEMES